MAQDVDWPTVGPRLLEALELLRGVYAAQMRRIPTSDEVVAITVNNRRHEVNGILAEARSAIAAAKGETT